MRAVILFVVACCLTLSAAAQTKVNDVYSKEAVEAALRKLMPNGDKLVMHDGVVHEGYALQSWLNPVSDTGGETLLRYDAAKGQWVVLDTDSVLAIGGLLSKGVPKNVATTLFAQRAELEAKNRRAKGGANGTDALTKLDADARKVVSMVLHQATIKALGFGGWETINGPFGYIGATVRNKNVAVFITTKQNSWVKVDCAMMEGGGGICFSANLLYTGFYAK
jgi:hypothetical protein